MEISCRFENLKFDKSQALKYFCVVTSCIITEPRTRIKSIKGAHLPHKTDEDVEAIEFRSTYVEYFPRGIHKIFSNLTGLKIHYCGLKKIFRKDLIGLEDLTDLYICHNPLQALPSDLFTDMSKLTSFSFKNNELVKISSQLFMPMQTSQLVFVDFRYNKKLHAFYGTSTSNCKSLEELIGMIKANCSEPVEDKQSETFMQNISRKFRNLWKSGEMSDFVITVEATEFRVHKIVLAVQSAVFADLFKSSVKGQSREMKIQNCSAAVIEEFLNFIYTGRMKTYNNTTELFALATKFKVCELKSICEEIILDNLDESNAYQVFTLGRLYKSTEMKQKAFDEMNGMFPGSLLDSDLINNPDRLKELIDAKRHCDSLLQKCKKQNKKECEEELSIEFKVCHVK